MGPAFFQPLLPCFHEDLVSSVPSVARAKADADVPAWRERVEKKKNKDGKKREVQEEKEEEEEEHGSGKKEEEREWRGGRAGEREIVPR